MPAPAEAFEYDAFISYSHADQEWVRGWLAPTLRDAGLRICVDYDSFPIGRPIVAAIEHAVVASRKTLMVLTPAYLDSDWGAFENILVQTLDPNAQQLRLLPILHIACEPPLRIRALNGVDLQQPDAAAVARLVAAIKEEALPPAPERAPVWPAPAQPEKAAAVELCIEFGPPSSRGATFPVTIRFPAQGANAGPFKFTPPLDAKVLTDLYWYLEVYPSWPTEIDDQRARLVEASLRNWGRKLFRKVFGDGDARTLFNEFKHTPADAHLLTVDIAFKVDDDDEKEQARLKQAVHDLAGLPWELLADEGGHLFNLKPPISVRRRLQKTNAPVERPRQLPVRVLMAVSRPEDATFIDPRTIAAPLLDALETLGNSVEVEFLRPPTLAALQSRLDDESLPPVDILHFDGHGVYRHDTGLGYLLFEDSQHGSDRVNADQLGTLLNQRGVAVVILNACQSAKAEETNPFGSVASRLVEAGIGSVVAMNYSLLVSTAERLAAVLYGNLAAGLTVGQALDSARRKLLSDTVRGSILRDGKEIAFHLTDWFLPALYQQTSDPAPFRGASPLVSPSPAHGRGGRGVRAGLPPEPQHRFHGRGRELLALERLFAAKPAVVLHGFGGQGKTSLAAHAARWLTRTGLFARAAFVSFEHGADLDFVLAELGNALVSDDFAIHEGDPVTAVAEALAATPTLVVFDNFESVLPNGDAPLPPDALKALLDAAARWFAGKDEGGRRKDEGGRMKDEGGRMKDEGRTTQYAVRNTSPSPFADSLIRHSRLLLTTRDPAIPHPFLAPGRACARYELPGLDPIDALQFAGAILADLGLPRPPRAGLSRLMGFLGNHPLSIQLVLPHLGEVKARGGDAVEAVIEEFAALLPGFTEGEGAERNQSLEVSLRFSLRRLGPEAAGLLPRLAVFQGGAIEAMLLGITGIDEAAWAGLKPSLANAALVRPEELPGVSVPYLHFHPTLAPYLARELPDAARARLEEQYWRGYYEFANYLYHSDTKNPVAARAIAARELPNLRRGLRLAVAAGALDAAVDFADSINKFLNVFGRWRERDEVAALVERAVAENESANQRIYESANGAPGDAPRNTHHAPRTTPAPITKAQFILESGRGERLLQAGRAGEAEAVFRALLARLDAGAGYDAGYDRTLTLGRIGRCLRDQGRPAAAAAQHRAALAAAAALAQTELVRGAASGIHTDLADALRDMGQYAAARAEYETSLAINKAIGGDERGESVVLTQLGTLALAQGDLAEARRRYLEAMEFDRRVGNPRDLAIDWHQLGRVAQKARDWEEAERCYKEALRIREQIRDLPELAKTCNQLAIVAVSASRPAEAERWYRRAIELGEQLNYTGELGKWYNNLAGLLLAQGRLDEAEGYAQRARAIKETLDLSVEPWKTYAILAKIAERRGQVEAARGWRRKEQEAFAAFAGSEQKLPQWTEPVAQAVAAACQGDTQAIAVVEDAMRQLAGTTDWRALPPVIRRVMAGERDFEHLTDGLDRYDALIIRRIVARLAGGPGDAGRGMSRGMNSPSDTPKPAEAGSGEERAGAVGQARPAEAGPGEGRAGAVGQARPAEAGSGEAGAGTGGEAQGEGLTLEQLLDLVARAVRGDRNLGMQLFPAMQQMAGDRNAPPALRALGGVLARVLIGDRNPDLAALPPELASAVRGMLARLKV